MVSLVLLLIFYPTKKQEKKKKLKKKIQNTRGHAWRKPWRVPKIGGGGQR